MADHSEAFTIIKAAEKMQDHGDKILDDRVFDARTLGLGMLTASLKYLIIYYKDVSTVIDVLRAQADEIERQHRV
jgi:hypothetical protein|tara:strand:- start:5108 stop:5332 length:225 start_codon:yes stop_codon:yes gene_type:complete